MVGQAAVARRLGDLARARALLDAAASHYQHVVIFPLWRLAPAWPGGRWLHSSWPTAWRVAPLDAANGASGDPTTQLLADTATAAVKATADPTGANTCACSRFC